MVGATISIEGEHYELPSDKSPAYFVPPPGNDMPFEREIGYEWEGRPMAQTTHVSFLKYDGSWTEFCRKIGQLPARGAFFIATSAKLVDMSGGLSRALAIKTRGAKGVVGGMPSTTGRAAYSGQSSPRQVTISGALSMP